MAAGGGSASDGGEFYDAPAGSATQPRGSPLSGSDEFVAAEEGADDVGGTGSELLHSAVEEGGDRIGGSGSEVLHSAVEEGGDRIGGSGSEVLHSAVEEGGDRVGGSGSDLLDAVSGGSAEAVVGATSTRVGTALNEEAGADQKTAIPDVSAAPKEEGDVFQDAHSPVVIGRALSVSGGVESPLGSPAAECLEDGEGGVGLRRSSPESDHGSNNPVVQNSAVHPLERIAHEEALFGGEVSRAPSTADVSMRSREATSVSPPCGAESASHCVLQRVKAHGEGREAFSALRAVQILDAAASGPVFRVRFSPDGSFLVAASDDGSVRLWALRSGGTRSADVFDSAPRHVWTGHTGAVIDVSVSRAGLVLSASLDRTVRLWHASRAECLGVFRHPDAVTSVAFHPRDERVFASGCLDCRLRLWSAAARRVLEWKGLPPGNMVTAVSFSPGGRSVLAGTATGVLLVFDVALDGSGGGSLSYASQVHVHSRRGRNRVGKKICAVRALPGGAPGDARVLVSSNDSRLRLYALSDRALLAKYVGHANAASHIDASFSDDGERIVAGSEDGRVYLWDAEDRRGDGADGDKGESSARRGFWACWLGRLLSRAGGSRRVRPAASFEASARAVSCAAFAPAAAAARLQALGLRPATAAGAPATLIVAADLGGAVRVFENSALLEAWLCEASSADPA